MENWKQIEDFPMYEISDQGKVRSNKFGKTRILKPIKARRYLQVVFYNSGEKSRKQVHRLVLETFIGPCPEGMVASHLDDICTNNHVDNLVWESQADNNRRRKSTKLSELEVIQIRQLLKQGWKLKKLGEKFGVSFQHIGDIKLNRKWKIEGTL